MTQDGTEQEESTNKVIFTCGSVFFEGPKKKNPKVGFRNKHLLMWHVCTVYLVVFYQMIT